MNEVLILIIGLCTMNLESRSALVRRVDNIFSKYIRLRDGFCFTCGTPHNLTCGHYISRIHMATRFDEDNCHAQCISCNRLHETDPSIYTSFMEKAVVEKLRDSSGHIKKYTREELKDLYLYYKKRVDEMAPGYFPY